MTQTFFEFAAEWNADCDRADRQHNPKFFAPDGSLLVNRPSARITDKPTAHVAAAALEPANSDLISAIRKYVYLHALATAFEVADALAGARWQADTVRSAVCRAGLVAVDEWGWTPRGHRCARYVLRTEPTDPL